MPRYVTRPRTKSWVEDDDCWEADIAGHIPTVDEHDPVDTGLMDKDGNIIWRVKDPIGFVHYGG